MMVKFSRLIHDDAGNLVESEVREIARESIMQCPHYIMVPEHYREDGTCRCNDRNHREMKVWGYKWNGNKWK